MLSYPFDIECISKDCVNCPKMDIDVITKELIKVVYTEEKDSTESLADGYYNYLRCKYVDECKKIFENGYKVIKEETPNDIPKVTIEEKPESKKRSRKSKAETVSKDKTPTKTKKVSKK